MSTVSIYDIATQQWYEQGTTGTTPPQLTQGCTVLASAQDGSSHNIYWYGGFDGIRLDATLDDDVWVLSIPSFTWIKLSSGITSHARAGRTCAKPYPDQMVVIGGYTSLEAAIITCLEDFVGVFNLSSGAWLDRYDPAVWSNYTVSSAIIEMIGGSPTGGATQTVPTPSGFTNSNLSKLFSEKYDSSKMTTYYPYPSATGGGGTIPSH